MSFPGGARDPVDESPIDTALREAAEETGLRPESVTPVLVLPRLHIPVSGFGVSAVLARWRDPGLVAPQDPDETEAVFRVPLTELADPARRLVHENGRGWRGPAFRYRDTLIWGYTGELLAAVLRLGGWER